MIPVEQCRHCPLFTGLNAVELSRLPPLLIKRPFPEDNSAPRKAALGDGGILVDKGKKLWMVLVTVL